MGNKTIFEWAEMFQEQIQNGASQSDVIQMLEDYKSQALRIHAVVGRSEQLVCEYCNEDAKPTCCDNCLEGMVNAVQKAN